MKEIETKAMKRYQREYLSSLKNLDTVQRQEKSIGEQPSMATKAVTKLVAQMLMDTDLSKSETKEKDVENLCTDSHSNFMESFFGPEWKSTTLTEKETTTEEKTLELYPEQPIARTDTKSKGLVGIFTSFRLEKANGKLSLLVSVFRNIMALFGIWKTLFP